MPGKIDFRKDLNEEQFAAVTAGDGPALVIAGAGSGKTRVVTYRVAWLLDKGADPESVLLVTFTNKAAGEMLGRAARLAGETAVSVWGGTFHHVANMILRKHAHHLGYDRNYTILDRGDSHQVIRDCLREGEFSRENGFPKPAVLGAIAGLAANTNEPVETVIENRFPHLSLFTEEISSIISMYDRKKKELNGMDFDDLILNCYRLLTENDDVRARLAGQFHHILVDEYQDTNVLQAEIVDAIASEHGNIMVVGDDSQSIYGFRGAVIRNILDFPKRYPEVRSYRLETNYRSTPAILRAANSSISYNVNQFPKRLRAERTGEDRPIVAAVKDVYAQAEFVAREIGRLLAAGTPRDEIAVLYRAHYHSMELQSELASRGLGFEVRGGPKFFEQLHVKDVIAYLRIVDNALDEVAWKRVLLLCAGIGAVTAEKLWARLCASQEPLVEIASPAFLKAAPKRARAAVTALADTVSVLHEAAGEGSPCRLVRLVLDCGYEDHLQSAYPDYADRLQDLLQLERFASKYDDAASFLTELALMTDAAGEEPGTDADRNGKIVLSTIHQAKGLEWAVVFLIWLADGKMPSARSLAEEGGEEEERRLFYVALTRARDRLFLIYPGASVGPEGYWSTNSPSRFLGELEPGTYEQVGPGFPEYADY